MDHEFLNFKERSKVSSNSHLSSLSSLSILKEQSSLSIKNERKEFLDQRINENLPTMLNVATNLIIEEEFELLFVFDKSGSCIGLEESTISEYNKVIEKFKNENAAVLVSTILFSDKIEEKEYRNAIENVGTFEYKAQGGTSLYDALCSYILRIRNAQAKENNKIKQTIVMIMTDGNDTSSVNYDSAATQKLVKECKDDGWIFLFIGSLTNSANIAASIGLSVNDTATCLRASGGISSSFAGLYNLMDVIQNNRYKIISSSDEVKKILDSQTKRLELKK